MGVTGSKETRRLSFDNTFALSTALVVPKAIEDENILDLDVITAVTDREKEEQLFFPEPSQYVESEKEFSDIDYWTNRVDSLKKEHHMINKIIEEEYEKTLKRTRVLVEQSEETPEKLEQIRPAFEYRAKILKCYQENHRQPLVCSPLVQAFSNCVMSCKVQNYDVPITSKQ